METPFAYTKAAFWDNKKVYTMWILQLLAAFPLTGFFGIDHLYLRSPITALAKVLVNVFTFGFWYFYDLIQFTLDKETVEKFGASVPFYGPVGLGSGLFVKEGESVDPTAAAPWRYVLFAILSLLPFGLDYVLAGDYVGAGLRIFSLVSIILWPLVFIWSCINIYRTWLNPTSVFKYGTYRIWPFNWFVDANFSVKGVLAPGVAGSEDPACRQKGVLETLLEPVTSVVGVATKAATDVVLEPLAKTMDGIAEIPGAVRVPLQDAVERGLAPSVEAGLKVATLLPAAAAAVPRAAEAASKGLKNATAAAATKALVGGTATAAVQQTYSDVLLLATLAVLVFGGAILTVFRSRDNGTPDEDDTPPNPGTVRTPSTAAQSDAGGI